MRALAAIATALAVLALTGAAAAAVDAAPQQHGDSLGADWREQQNEARAAVRAGRHLPLSQVVAGVNARIPGRLLDTGLETAADGRPVYRIRWAASDGRRLDVIADARTGEILRQEGR